MRLKPETLARKRPQQHHLTEHLRHDVEEQLELDGLPLMTANRAKDLCQCAKPCEPRHDADFDYLGR